MVKNREVASKINDILNSICELICEGNGVVSKAGSPVPSYAKTFCLNMAHVMGNEIYDIFADIYAEHPDLAPSGIELPIVKAPKSSKKPRKSSKKTGKGKRTTRDSKVSS